MEFKFWILICSQILFVVYLCANELYRFDNFALSDGSVVLFVFCRHRLFEVESDLLLFQELLAIWRRLEVIEEDGEHGHSEEVFLMYEVVFVVYEPISMESLLETIRFELVKSLLEEWVFCSWGAITARLDIPIVNDSYQENHEFFFV